MRPAVCQDWMVAERVGYRVYRPPNYRILRSKISLVLISRTSSISTLYNQISILTIITLRPIHLHPLQQVETQIGIQSHRNLGPIEMAIGAGP